MSSTTIAAESDISEQTTGQLLSTEIISTESGFDAIAEEWNALVEVADAYIFQTYEWQRIWWRIFGGNNSLHILLFRDGKQLVGIMPMFFDYFRIMGFPIYRSLRLIGSRIIQPESGSVPVELAFSDYLSMIAHPDYEQEVSRSLKNYLQSNPEMCDEIILEEVPENSSLLTSLLPAFDDHSDWEYEVNDASVCPRIEFPESWDDLLSDLSSNARYQIRRDIRRVTEDEIFELHTAQTREEARQAFWHLVEFHQRRWQNLGQPGIFADDRILEFFREITMKFHKKGWLSFKSVTAEGQYIAIDLLFKFKGTMYMIQRGFDDSSEYNQYGPGNVLLYCVIKEAIQDGLKAYDFLRGEESYKLRTANKTPQNKKVILQNGNGNQKNRLVRRYAHVKRKLQNEKHVAGVHLKKQGPASAANTYLKKLFQRGKRKLTNSNDDDSN